MKPETQPLLQIDRWGRRLSLACAVHCMAVPLLFVLLPWSRTWQHSNERLEAAILAASFSLAACSVCSGYRLHRRKSLVAVFGFAMGLILVGRFGTSDGLESVLMILGALSLSAGHWL